MERSRRVIKAGGEEMVESFNLRLIEVLEWFF